MIKTSTGDPWTYTGQNLTAEYQIPSAKLAVKKQLLRVYDNFFIYLNDGIEYEIELYNPTTIEYLAKIKLDGEFVDILYNVPTNDIFENPKTKKGELRKPYKEFINNKNLERFNNGFVVFTPVIFKKKKKEIDLLK